MKISYISPKKNVNNFSSRINKPVLIFNTDKYKDKDRERDLSYMEIKKKILNDSSNKIDYLDKDYGLNNNNNYNNNNKNNNYNNNLDLNFNLNRGKISPPKIKLQNGGHSKHINVHLINNGNGKNKYKFKYKIFFDYYKIFIFFYYYFLFYFILFYFFLLCVYIILY
jgi:hypothetical protein